MNVTLAPSFGVRERNEHKHQVRQHGERPRFVCQGQGTNHIHYVITLSNISYAPGAVTGYIKQDNVVQAMGLSVLVSLFHVLFFLSPGY